MKKNSLQNLGNYLLWTLAILVLALLAWAVWLRLQYSYDGVLWSNKSGLVNRIDPSGPAAGLLEEGDRILAIDGKPISQVSSLYFGKQSGYPVTFSINRQGVRHSIDLLLAEPPWNVLITTLLPILVGLFFWVTGIIILVFQQNNFPAQLFTVICLIGSSLLAVGSISLIGPAQVKLLFYVLLWWMAPLLFHFHLLFPASNSTKSLHALRTSFYGIAALGTVMDLVFETAIVDAGFAYSAFYFFRRIWLALGFCGAVFLLIRVYMKEPTGTTRSQVGVVTLGGTLAFASFLSFTLIPEALFGKQILPYDISFLFLLAMPISYGYAIFRHRLIPLEKYVNRGATSALLLILLSGLYLVLNTVLVRLILSPLWDQTILNMILALFMAAIFGRLHRRLQVFVNYLFYGGWYDYQSAVKQISQTLEPVSDQQTLAQSLVREIQAAMQLECACILLIDGKEQGSSRGLVCQSCQSGLPQVSQLSSVGAILHYFQSNPTPIEPQNLRMGLGEETLSNVKSELLSCRKARLWIPIKSARQINGLLILGVRRGGSRFTTNDLEILDVISRQANIALDNIRLVAELYERDLERLRLHQQALRAGEKERKRLARELHDQIIQALVGFNFQLAELRRPLNPDLQTRLDQSQFEVRTIIGRLRRICADLRPPAMDSLGLVAVVRSQVRTTNETAPFRTTLEVEGDDKTELSEELIMCVYRVLQEALLNASKHSDAQRVQVKLCISPDQVSLVIKDDGKGFVVPDRLGQFTMDDHFGLLGMYERVELVNGKLNIQSYPKQGCQVTVEIPLLHKETISLVTN